MSERCKETVYIGAWSRPSQCSRNATKDGFCKQHHPDSKAERVKKSREAYKAKREQSDWYLLSKARERIAELEAAQRWIPVSERLPPEGSNVLFYHPDCRVAIGSRRGCEMSIGLCNDQATHWALILLPPLPAPQQEAE